MKCTPVGFEGMYLVEPRVFRDERGHFLETWSDLRYRDAGIPGPFVQDNVSVSSSGVLRGLHLQVEKPQGKLVSVLDGEVFDVAVDLRPGSRTLGRWSGFRLSSENAHQLYIPAGCAHGFVVLSPRAVFAYKCTEYYDPASEVTLSWNDPNVGIEWPVREPILSEKDRDSMRIEQVLARTEAFARGR
jgi:dTDP-4-dehydrorhamnose 3,5-epimerase